MNIDSRNSLEDYTPKEKEVEEVEEEEEEGQQQQQQKEPEQKEQKEKKEQDKILNYSNSSLLQSFIKSNKKSNEKQSDLKTMLYDFEIVKQNIIRECEELNQMARFEEKCEYVPKKLINLVALSSWNVWGVPIGSDLIFHRPPHWREFNDLNLKACIQRTYRNYLLKKNPWFYSLTEFEFQKHVNTFLQPNTLEDIELTYKQMISLKEHHLNQESCHEMNINSTTQYKQTKKKRPHRHQQQQQDIVTTEDEIITEKQVTVTEKIDNTTIIEKISKIERMGKIERTETIKNQDLEQKKEENDDNEILAIPNLSLQMDLIVSTFQEAFSFRQGWGMQSAAESKGNQWMPEGLLLAGGLVKSWLNKLSFQETELWDCPANLLNSGGSIIPFRSVVGKDGISLHSKSLVDSGLCILSTWDPVDYGFYAYKNYPMRKGNSNIKMHEEVLANKGVLWSYYRNDKAFQNRSTADETDETYLKWCACHDEVTKEPRIGTVIVTTHLTTHSRYKTLQINELIGEFKKLREKFISDCDILEIYLTGDFNLCYSDNDLFVDDKETKIKIKILTYLQKELELIRLNRGKATAAGMDRCLDHIWMWRGVNPKAENYQQLKDIYMQNIVWLNDDPQKPWLLERNGICSRDKGVLADHMWQGITVSSHDNALENVSN